MTTGIYQIKLLRQHMLGEGLQIQRHAKFYNTESSKTTAWYKLGREKYSQVSVTTYRLSSYL